MSDADAVERSDLEDLLRRLGDIQDQLIALPDDAFAERFELRELQARLRHEAAEVTSGQVEPSLEQLRAKVQHVRARLEAHFGNRLPHTSGWQSGMGGGTDPAAIAAMNASMDTAAGLEQMQSELSRLRDKLASLESDQAEESD